MDSSFSHRPLKIEQVPSPPRSPVLNATFSSAFTDATATTTSTDDLSGGSHITASNADGATAADEHIPSVGWMSGQDLLNFQRAVTERTVHDQDMVLYT